MALIRVLLRIDALSFRSRTRILSGVKPSGSPTATGLRDRRSGSRAYGLRGLGFKACGLEGWGLALSFGFASPSGRGLSSEDEAKLQTSRLSLGEVTGEVGR